MPLTPLNQRDETASKIPAPAHGFGAFCASSGYAQVICCPFVVVTVIVAAIRKKIKTKREEKEAMKAAEGRVNGNGNGNGNGNDSGLSAAATQAQEKPSAKHRDARVSAAADGAEKRLETHPDNPRVCDPLCPARTADGCPVHTAQKFERPASPGLLAV
ncbi:hypothetical protein B0T24DRAFT_341214 [Lasiosphaeria ovina]|uniref:Uncharacterized protein n=1 Tax=Lasiosphaeria ovina TaxID=92902 RepID=A0AAE0N3I5_9PEZI|nr:hypothetical protein B0T24DRAFT_341214 [Lasiosphaeria ovina]